MKRDRVLLVKDHGPTRTALAGELERLGEHVIMASNGPEAMAVLDHRDDIALLVIGTLASSGMNKDELRTLAAAGWPHLQILSGSLTEQASRAANGNHPTGAPIAVADDLISQFARQVVETMSKLRK